ncbi:MAG TPA: type VI secretion system baseplate subunit TssK [Longimicrobiaceae bacterium]|nr:type VI secretion system baseplate subunit TssK [Longimicrobiaceae bacterium]
MKSLSRVVWSEGMHLSQHHFQAQGRHFTDLATFTVGSLFFKPYGLSGCGLDAEALLNGTVSITHAQGLMPDGMAFDFPVDSTPDPLGIRDLFSPTNDSELVSLTIPAYRPGERNCANGSTAGRSSLRYRALTRQVTDESTGADEKPIAFAGKNFRLVLGTVDDEDLVSLPLARVRRDGSGNFVYDQTYVPPCTQIGASASLMQLLRRLIELLDGRADAIRAERQESHESLADYASREIASFWLSHAIHSSLAPLRQHLRSGRSHPEQLFVEMGRLAGALCTFSMHSHPRDLPVYDHDDLGGCFSGLEAHIREHLEVISPSNCITVPLGLAEESLYVGAVTDSRCFDASRWYLGVRSDAGQGEVISSVPRLVKICSAQFISRLVKEGLPALSLDHVQSPPPELSPRPGTQYFSIGKTLPGHGGSAEQAPCWKAILASGEVGIYVPASIPDPEMELLVVLES